MGRKRKKGLTLEEHKTVAFELGAILSHSCSLYLLLNERYPKRSPQVRSFNNAFMGLTVCVGKLENAMLREVPDIDEKVEDPTLIYFPGTLGPW